MARSRFLATFVAVAVAVAACSGDRITAESCDEVVDVTMDLLQRLIDDVDAQAGDLTVQDFIDSEGELPSVARFEEDAAKIDEIAAELGCTRSEISSAVDARVAELTTTTDLGRFLINAIRAGGL